MGNKSPFGGPLYGAEGDPALILVDRILSTSYDVVRFVAENINVVQALYDGRDEILALGPYVNDIHATAANIGNVNIVGNNYPQINEVANRIDQILDIFANMDQILTAKDQAVTSAGNANNSAIAAEQAKQDSIVLKNTLLSGISAVATMATYGSPPTAVYDPDTKQISFGIPVAPLVSFTIGSVTQGPAAASLTGTDSAKILNLVIPKGDSSWSPVYANVVDGARIVQKVVDWIGGSGAKPDINVYISGTGYTTDIAAATNVRGPTGPGTGDMSALVYDPTLKNADAFSMGNMAETSTKKILSDTERTKLAGIAAGATVNASDAALRDRATHTGSQAISTVTGLQTALDATEKTANKGQANGYASLGADSKIPVAQLPESVLGAMNYQGTWNASTNVPAIPAASGANKGWYYSVATAGTTAVSGVNDWEIGDWIVSNGTKWEKIDSSDQVTSVNGQKGTVVLTKGSVGLGNVDNTSDANKPVSTPTQTALNSKADLATTTTLLGTKVSVFPLIASAVATSIAAEVSHLMIAEEKFGPTIYKKVGSNPGTSTSFQSADGAWWVPIDNANPVGAVAPILTPVEVDMHFEILRGNGWGGSSEPGGIVATTITASGTNTLTVASVTGFFQHQLICYVAADGQYYSANIKDITGSVLTLDSIVQPVSVGGGVYNFYNNDAHPNTHGFRCVADAAIRLMQKQRHLAYSTGSNTIWSSVGTITASGVEPGNNYTNSGAASVTDLNAKYCTSSNANTGLISAQTVELPGGTYESEVVVNPGTRSGLSNILKIEVVATYIDASTEVLATVNTDGFGNANRTVRLNYRLRNKGKVQIRVTCPNSGPWTFWVGRVRHFRIRGSLPDLNQGKHVIWGDSWAANPDFVARIAARLPKATIVNKGTGGVQSSALLTSYATDVAPEKAMFVWCLVGTNDVYASVTASAFQSNMDKIINLIQSGKSVPLMFNVSVCSVNYAPPKLSLSREYAMTVQLSDWIG